MNRLASAKSPYLLQHADNPVHWFEWCEEAFDKAKAENKLVFLSIGYSTCHWCHVMAHESFEDDDVASVMKEDFVSIKVDREERPDIDGVYMAACQMMTGHGGWPLTVIMTPDKKPIFTGTYIPKESRFGRIGLIELLQRISAKWKSDEQTLKDSAELITRTLTETEEKSSSGQEPGSKEMETAYLQLKERFDGQNGGFGSAPKFPTPHNLYFLLRYWKRTEDKNALLMVEKTLEAFAKGGMWDHLGYGFHRYSTDRKWLLPHFEKMLYDQALISLAFIEAYQATDNKHYQDIAEHTFTYVLRDLLDEKGAFYSAEDADSEGEEGKFYLWSKCELDKLLGEAAPFFIEQFNVLKGGNFVDEATHEKTGTNILHQLGKEPLEDDEQIEQIENSRKILFEARLERVRPGLDDKILTDWNGLMIAALSRGGFIFEKDEYVAAARRAADFILETMRDKEGRLYHRYRDGHVGLNANLDDYAYFTWGLFELYEATFELKYLRQAMTFVDDMVDHFWDEKRGAFFFTADDDEELIYRRKESYDGARPAGNSVAYLVLQKASRYSGKVDYDKRAAELARSLGHSLFRLPSVHTFFLCGTDFALGPASEIVIAGERGKEDTNLLLSVIRDGFHPNKVVLFHPAGLSDEETQELPGHARSCQLLEGKATAYVCRDFTCGLPVTNVGDFAALLKKKEN